MTSSKHRPAPGRPAFRISGDEAAKATKELRDAYDTYRTEVAAATAKRDARVRQVQAETKAPWSQIAEMLGISRALLYKRHVTNEDKDKED